MISLEWILYLPSLQLVGVGRWWSDWCPVKRSFPVIHFKVTNAFPEFTIIAIGGMPQKSVNRYNCYLLSELAPIYYCFGSSNTFLSNCYAFILKLKLHAPVFRSTAGLSEVKCASPGKETRAHGRCAEECLKVLCEVGQFLVCFTAFQLPFILCVANPHILWDRMQIN